MAELTNYIYLVLELGFIIVSITIVKGGGVCNS